MSILLFLSFIILIFIGFPVAWTMGGLAVLFTLIAMLSDNYLDTFFGVDWKFSSMVVYRLYGVMANWVLVALPMFIFMGIMMDKSGIAEDLMTDLAKLFGRMRGGLSNSSCFYWSAISSLNRNHRSIRCFTYNFRSSFNVKK